jgi:hypothetical protein
MASCCPFLPLRQYACLRIWQVYPIAVQERKYRAHGSHEEISMHRQPPE